MAFHHIGTLEGEAEGEEDDENDHHHDRHAQVLIVQRFILR
jgi:hypothetical protein